MERVWGVLGESLLLRTVRPCVFARLAQYSGMKERGPIKRRPEFRSFSSSVDVLRGPQAVSTHLVLQQDSARVWMHGEPGFSFSPATLPTISPRKRAEEASDEMSGRDVRTRAMRSDAAAASVFPHGAAARMAGACITRRIGSRLVSPRGRGERHEQTTPSMADADDA